MARRQQSSPAEDSVPQDPQVQPLPSALPGHDFTLQAVIEMQRTLGQLDANISGLKGSVDGLKTKVDDLVAWKHKLVGGAAVLVVVGGIIGWLIKGAADYVTLKVPAQTSVVVQPAAATATAPVSASPPSPGSK